MESAGFPREPAFLLRVRVLRKLFRRLFLTRRISLYDAGKLAFFGGLALLADRRAFLCHLARRPRIGSRLPLALHTPRRDLEPATAPLRLDVAQPDFLISPPKSNKTPAPHAGKRGFWRNGGIVGCGGRI
jgi:hypothetical protein